MPKPPRVELLDKAKGQPEYCNSMVVTSSQLDFQILFGYHDAPDNPELTKIFSKIAMSPQHYKAFVDILQQQLRKYEEEFGAIVLKKDLRMGER